jgi:hypothetical protein
MEIRNADPLPGPTGVEAAGELGFEYGKNKEITLVIHPSFPTKALLLTSTR